MMRLWRWLASFRRRILFRAIFAALALATLALALAVLRQEKQLAIDNYAQGLRKTEAQVLARLRHPSGQLALMNPQSFGGAPLLPLTPLVLPYSALDADDPVRMLQAAETAGCGVQYPAQGLLCVAVANNAWSGGFVHVAGHGVTGPLQSRARGERDAGAAHRVEVEVDYRGRRQRWVAPFERGPDARRGRLEGFELEDDGGAGRLPAGRPQREFRGWLWQDPQCAQAAAAPGDCPRRAYFSLRLPVQALREALFSGASRPAWPPADLAQLQVHLRVLAPGGGAPLLDSDNPAATPSFSLDELRALLLPGETLQVLGGRDAVGPPLFTLKGAETAAPAAPWLARLVRRLPVGDAGPIASTASVDTPLGPRTLVLTGDVRSVDAMLAGVAARLAGYVAAMLLAILLAWGLIELALIRRIALLTRRARAVSQDLTGLRIADLRGHDELGILAGALADLLQRVKEEVQREHLRAEREKDLWHAVGHEIMSPLQSLLALHGTPGDPSARYIERMQQAVRVLYGSASPSEAFETTALQVQPLDLLDFLRHVARNAPAAGIADVRLEAPAGLQALPVRADEYPLEDVVTHVLRNAARHREPATPIVMRLSAEPSAAELRVHNQGRPIAPEMLERIFEYGVSDPSAPASGEGGRRGQGLFVAKTYLAKMGGTIEALNEQGGVTFVIRLQRA